MRSIAVKLTLAFLLVGLTGALLVSVILQLRTRAAFDQFILNREQQTLVDTLMQYYAVQGSWVGVEYHFLPGDIQKHPVPGGQFVRRDFVHFTLAGMDGAIIFSSGEEKIGRNLADEELDQAIPLTVDNETVGWVLLTPLYPEWVTNSPEAIFLSNINRAALASGLVAAALALSVGSILAFTMTRSLRELTEATVEIARGKLGRQVTVRSKDEIGELAASFNQMSADLARATLARRQMTADIAHDLRSPLSVLSGYAEALNDGKLPGTPETYAIFYQETQHLSHLVDDLRTLSLADTGELTLNLLPTSPQTLLERIATRHTLAAQQRGISLKVVAIPELPNVTVDPERMAQVFDNLVNNAFRYTPAGGEIELSAKMESGSVQLAVRDTGSGISAEDQPHIFDRFYRGDTSRQENGESGLGLAIAKSIIEAQGGTITVESAPGQGAVFTIRLKPLI